MSDMLLQALKKKLEGDVAVAKANIMIYKEKSVGIGEHPEIVQAIEMEVAKAAEAQDKLNMCNRLLDEKEFIQD
jgi:predicted AAA+ superfamily ATPase